LSDALGKLHSDEISDKDSIRAAERLLIDALKKRIHSAIRLRKESAATLVTGAASSPAAQNAVIATQ